MSGNGQVSVRVILEVGHPEAAAFEAWAARLEIDVATLTNEGCGCCVDIYTFESSAEAAAQLHLLLEGSVEYS